MCTKEDASAGATAAAVRAPRARHDDDIWADDSSSSGSSDHGGPSSSSQRASHLDREWQARKQQFYAAGFREGVAEAKEATLQPGFNAGFSEGAQAGYEFGLVKGALQTLAAHLPADHPARAQVAALQQQLAALSEQTVMRDTCRALLGQPPVDAVAQHLQAALALADDHADASGSGGRQHQQPQASGGSAQQQQQQQPPGEPSSLPQQLVRHMKQQLLELGFDVGSAPPLTVASAPPPPQAAAGGSDDGSS